MKIYEIGTGYTPIPAQMGAATEIVVEELTKAFLKQGIPVEIVDIAAKDRAPHQLPIREVKVPECFAGTDVKLGIMHKLKRVVYSIALAGELKKILKAAEEKVVLHFHNQYNLFFFLKLAPKRLRRKCCIAYTNHSGIWRMPWNEIEETIKKRYFQEAECMKRADVVFLLNQPTKYNVMTHLGVPEERLVVIGNGVNTEVYHPLTEAQKQGLKEKFGFGNKKVILQVGSVYENKGQLRSIQYLEPLMKRHPELLYVYAGGIVDETYHWEIVDYADEHGLSGQVRYVGMVSPGEELNELYNIAEMTFFSSRYEGFALVVIESLAVGVPVLMNCGAEFHMGEGCVTLEESGQVEGLLIDNDQKLSKFRVAARQNAQNYHSWESVARCYYAFWNQ